MADLDPGSSEYFPKTEEIVVGEVRDSKVLFWKIKATGKNGGNMRMFACGRQDKTIIYVLDIWPRKNKTSKNKKDAIPKALEYYKEHITDLIPRMAPQEDLGEQTQEGRREQAQEDLGEQAQKDLEGHAQEDLGEQAQEGRREQAQEDLGEQAQKGHAMTVQEYEDDFM